MKDEMWIEAMGQPCCSDCRFFSEIETLDDGTVRGECHKAPPTIMFGSGDTGTWPVIEASEWCGEFEMEPSARRAFEAEWLERWNGRLK